MVAHSLQQVESVGQIAFEQ